MHEKLRGLRLLPPVRALRSHETFTAQGRLMTRVVSLFATMGRGGRAPASPHFPHWCCYCTWAGAGWDVQHFPLH
ncbi:hypothetical protein B566_EDAN015681 [Ephemera danica]|nr:hypothetical protein B566_EDAN015681 [Ephemera danica]